MQKRFAILGLLGAISIATGLFAFVPGPLHAQVTVDLSLGQTFGLGTADLQNTVVNVVKWALGLLALVGTVVIIYGGFLWILSRGNEQKIDKAKRVIRDAIIGTIIVLMAWAIVIFFIGGVTNSTGGGPPGGGSCVVGACTSCGNICGPGGSPIPDPACGPPHPICSGGGAQFKVIWTYPANGATNVPQCSIIQARFNDTVDPATVDSTTVLVTDQTAGGAALPGSFTVLNDIIKFSPQTNYNQDSDIRMQITVGVMSQPATGPPLPAVPYQLDFTTGSVLDTTPPQITTVYPAAGEPAACLNTVVGTTFNEAIDATTVYPDRTCDYGGTCPGGTCTCDDPGTGRSCTVAVGASTCTIEGTVQLYDDPPPAADRGLTKFTWGNAQSFTAKQETPPLTQGSTYNVWESGDLMDGIKDTCGNPLDGNADGTASGGSGTPNANPPATGDDYQWDFVGGPDLVCDPVISSINPTSGWYSDGLPPGNVAADTEVTINGQYFTTIQGNTIFNKQVYDFGTCFDKATNHMIDPANSCIASWTDTQIVARVPTDSRGTSPITVVAGGTNASSADFTVNSPRIGGLAPGSGNTNDFVTITGSNFLPGGAQPGTVWFRNAALPGGQIAGTIPNVAQCANSYWQDTQIVIQVPDFAGAIAIGTVLDIQVQADHNGDGNLDEWSDPEKFTFTSGPPKPGICGAQPTCGNAGTQVQLFGQNFGTGGLPPSGSSVSMNATPVPSYVSWNNQDIQFNSDSGLPNARYSTVVTTNPGGGTPLNSNPWMFDIPCGNAPSVVQSSSCDLAVPVIPSPYPQRDRTDACVNAGGHVEFSTDMNNVGAANPAWPGSILNPANYEVEDCGTGTFDPANCGAPTNPTSVTLGTPVGAGEAVDLSLIAGTLNQDTWYRVTVKSMVEDASTGARMNSDYQWKFKTLNQPDCAVTNTWFNFPATPPPDYLAEPGQPGDTISYSAGIGNAGKCDVFNPALYTYTWDLINNSGAVQVTPPVGTGPSQTYNSLAPGNDRARFTVQTKSSSRKIIVDYCNTDLDCQDYDGDGANGGANDCDLSICDDTLKKCTPAFKNGTEFTPPSTAIDDWVTIRGCHFGANPGSVAFSGGGPPLATFPPVAQCGDTWRDDQIVAVVPAGSVNGPITVNTQKNGFSATTSAGWTSGPSVPGFCRLTPASGNVLSQTKAWGRLLGAAEPAPPNGFFFSPVAGPTPSTPADNQGSLSWTDDIIDNISVPTNAQIGSFPTVVRNAAGAYSNTIDYDTYTPARPVVTVTNPVNGATNICPNVVIRVTFDLNMDPDSIRDPSDNSIHPNVLLEQVDPVGARVPVGGRVGTTGNHYFFTPDSPLDPSVGVGGALYTYELTTIGDGNLADGNEQGVKSAGGLAMSGNHVFGFTLNPANEDLSTGNGTACAIKDFSYWILRNDGAGSVVPGESFPLTFLCNSTGCIDDLPPAWEADTGNSRRLITFADDGNGTFLDHTQTIVESDPANTVIKAGPFTGPSYTLFPAWETFFGTFLDGANGTEFVNVTVDDGNTSVTKRFKVAVNVCQNPWPNPGPGNPFVPYQDVVGAPKPPSTAASNFSTWYCRDGSPLLPNFDSIAELPPPANAGACTVDSDCPSEYQCEAGTCKSNILKQFLFTNTNEPGEVVGLQVRKNPNHLSPSEWYRRYVPGENQGSPQSTELAGYPAVREGRSTYVAGTNVVNGGPDQIYTNIWLWSYASALPDQICSNLAWNGSFEIDDGTDYDANTTTEDSIANNSLPDGWFHQGSGGWSLSSTAVEGTNSLQVDATGGFSVGVGMFYGFEVGKTYTVTGWVNRPPPPNLGSDAGLVIRARSCNSGSPASSCTNGASPPNNTGRANVVGGTTDPTQLVVGSTNGWQQATFTYTHQSDTHFLEVLCVADWNGGAGPTDTVFCDDIVIVEAGQQQQCVSSQSVISKIHGQMTANFDLNINTGDINGGQTGVDQIKRDHTRLNNLEDIGVKLINFQAAHGQYPALAGGTFLPQMSTSMWPSWGETLGAAIGVSAMPGDPRQGENANLGICVDPFDPSTCWDESAKIFQCPATYWNYAYQTDTDGTIADLHGKFEYTANWINPVAGTSENISTGLSEQCGAYPNSTCACYSHTISLP